MSALPLALDGYVRDWLDLLLRWLHVVAAIAWIGASFYFVLLDQSLRPPKEERDVADGVRGELWEVHGGGFYHVKKYLVAPPKLPDHLAWFKWEAYTTWLSGFALMVVLFYLDARTTLIDPAVADIEPWLAVLLSVVFLAAAWLVYDVLCRLLAGRELVLAAAVLGLVVLAAWGTSELYSPRAAWLQVGAMLGTAMAGNVFFVIIPAHWELIRAKQAGRDPDPGPGIKGKQRSVHNNYLTLPVLVTMLAAHSSFLYGRELAWLILVGLMLGGAAVRLFFNLRHGGRTIWAIPAAVAVAAAVVALVLRPDDRPAPPPGETIAFADVAPVIERRCVTCHATTPTQPGFSSAAAGLALETQAQIEARAEDVAAAVSARTMPLGNVTGMTDAERELVATWAAGR
ncbi:MAG: urate hydroxylase PuuD [Actinobacteria bacterium]|nr:urate hydroxylase PuuD [Actinomycetota bacterium]